MRNLLLVFAGLTLEPMLIRAADTISWGPAVNGFRLGVAITDNSNKGNLRLALRNIGPADIDVLLGGKTGIGPMYTVKFRATDPKGVEHELFYFGGATSVGGYLAPLLVRLMAGETYDLLLPLNKFVCVLNKKDIPLHALLNNRYSVRASVDVSIESAKWAQLNAGSRGPAQIWTGKAESGDFRLPTRPSR